MANRFGILTKYIALFESGGFGEWAKDPTGDGTLGHPFQMPFVKYSSKVNTFIDDVYRFMESNQDMGLYRYGEILSASHIVWGAESMVSTEASTLEAPCVMALIVGAVRAERFCDGALLDLLENGSICRWLLRLLEIDNAALPKSP